MDRQYVERALDGVNRLLTPAVDTNSGADSELQAIRNDLEMALEGEPQSVEPEEDYEPDLDPALEGDEAEEDEAAPEGMMSSYTGA